MNDNKPKTAAPREAEKRIGVNEKELETLLFWKENKIFEKSLEKPAGENPKGSFSFYDGPPFATGLPHHGSLMAGTVKDLIPRYQTMKGNSVRRMWGWDCHGLPIENLIEKKLGLSSKKDIEEFGIDKFNRDAYESVLQYEREWKEIIPRMGRFVDMDSPYKTMDATYTESIWWAWKSLYDKGLAYEGHKMMHICPRCETPLAQSEVGLEYHDVTDLSVTVKFELVDEPGTYILAWTTTPWTLPGNTALAVHKDLDYVKIKLLNDNKEEIFIILSKTIYEASKDNKHFMYDKIGTYLEYASSVNSEESKVRNHAFPALELKGSELIGKQYKPVFPYFKDADIDNKENIWKIWHADFITDDTGTGIAHEAPAFGADDMDLAKLHKIPVIKHVKMDGTFTAEVTDFAGMKVKKAGDTQSADIEIIKWLAHNGKLFEKHKIVHSYPLCWRCKTPLLNYATSSWFVDVPKMKEKLIKENQKIGWTPEHIRDGRFGKWLEGAREWAVSRSRYWGAPLPVWKNADGSKIKVIGSLEELALLNKEKPKNTYYAMRHAESVFNVEDKLDSLGNTHNTLTDLGRKQAEETGKQIKNLGVDHIIASPLHRTKETAEIVAKVAGVSFELHEDLREFDFGEFEHMKATEFRALRTIHENLSMRVPRGESFRDGGHRFMKVVAECEEKYKGKKLLFITHGSVVYMGTHEAELATDETIIGNRADIKSINVHNGEIIPFTPRMVPRDETGALNLHRPYIDNVVLFIDGEEYRRIGDVFDCWYESGAMPFASLHYPFENKDIFNKNYPADFIAESLDQTRGWFYSLINLGVGLFDHAPYKHVICNGLINAADGKKLSKSLGNYTDPLLLVEKYGADAFRLYLMSSPVVKGEMINFSDKELDEMYKKCILRLDNVMQLYALGKPENIIPRTDSKYPLDVWMISRIHDPVQM
jgi:isoleucyl-tRNA synthetase